MAAKNKLEVVPTLPTSQPSIEEMLSDRIAADIAADLDIGKLARFTIKKLGTMLKAKFIDWLVEDFSSESIALNEIEASALPSRDDEVKAA